MRPSVVSLMREYEADHRDPVNRAIHGVAVPLIVFHIVAMLDWVQLGTVTLAWPVVAAAAVFYLWAWPGPGLAVVVLATVSIPIGRATPAWLVIAIAIGAWTGQLLGHALWERRSPAFTRNLIQLLVGPLFVAALWLRVWPSGREA